MAASRVSGQFNIWTSLSTKNWVPIYRHDEYSWQGESVTDSSRNETSYHTSSITVCTIVWHAIMYDCREMSHYVALHLLPTFVLRNPNWLWNSCCIMFAAVSCLLDSCSNSLKRCMYECKSLHEVALQTLVALRCSSEYWSLQLSRLKGVLVEKKGSFKMCI